MILDEALKAIAHFLVRSENVHNQCTGQGTADRRSLFMPGQAAEGWVGHGHFCPIAGLATL
jgi:hypothetical protein